MEQEDELIGDKDCKNYNFKVLLKSKKEKAKRMKKDFKTTLLLK
jgi:hypothetical protein